MKIIVFGARGEVGSRIVAEAVARGHRVTAVVRNQAQISALPAQVETKVADVDRLEDTASLLAGQDLAISALRPATGNEAALVALTQSVLDAGAAAVVPVLIVGGAASLRIPDSVHTVLSAPGFLPEEVVPIARASFAQFEVCAAEQEAEWSYLSPPAMLTPGERTGNYRVGADTLLVDEAGGSSISMEDLAVAMLDEAEAPQHRRARFTVAH